MSTLFDSAHFVRTQKVCSFVPNFGCQKRVLGMVRWVLPRGVFLRAKPAAPYRGLVFGIKCHEQMSRLFDSAHFARNQKVHSFVSCFYLWMPKTNPRYGAAGFEPEGNTYGLQAQNQPRHTEDSFLVIGAMN